MVVLERQQLHSLIDTLPDSQLVEARHWLQEFRQRHRANGETSTPFVPVALGGLWKGESVNDDDLVAVRKEMTADFLEGLE